MTNIRFGVRLVPFLFIAACLLCSTSVVRAEESDANMAVPTLISAEEVDDSSDFEFTNSGLSYVRIIRRSRDCVYMEGEDRQKCIKERNTEGKAALVQWRKERREKQMNFREQLQKNKEDVKDVQLQFQQSMQEMRGTTYAEGEGIREAHNLRRQIQMRQDLRIKREARMQTNMKIYGSIDKDYSVSNDDVAEWEAGRDVRAQLRSQAFGLRNRYNQKRLDREEENQLRLRMYRGEAAE